ncbi:glutamate dehydrogenase [Altericroceibacterium spongiae]|uniref:Glutamate dehydrogenase n=1 Tax=Altericroceibacterium spongiae TaxID=2320269 RepID=A0A420EP82_9SPHN|nr:NAD-glutamate dehydrogenase domain-containing protein [Altericroceibacterium spongiae]RKF22487.1 glutamate dehydrogenase [Altericroceibacterium spongiae]
MARETLDEETQASQALTRQLVQRIEASLLPDEKGLPEDEIEDAARFLLEAAATRKSGEPVVLIQSTTGDRRFMRIACINRDMPFLVDSIAATISEFDVPIDRLVHPIVPVERDNEGRLIGIATHEATNATDRESMVYLETGRLDARQRRELDKALDITLKDVCAAVSDWPDMKACLFRDADTLEDREDAALLRWLGEGMMTHLGHIVRNRAGEQVVERGICRESARELLADRACNAAIAWFDERLKADGEQHSKQLLIVKANHISQVHRRVPLDLFITPMIENGEVNAISIHAGVWTSSALGTAPDEVPRLRRQFSTIMDTLHLQQASHDGKSLINALTKLPHDIIIGFSDEDIARVATLMMSLSDRPRPRLTLIAAPLQRHLFGFVWFPRDMLSTAMRQQIEHMLEEETGATTLDWSMAVEGGNLVMLRYVLDFRGRVGTPDETAINARLQDMLRGWSEAVEHELTDGEVPGRAAALAARYADAFPPSYRTDYGAKEAAQDIERIRRLTSDEVNCPEGRDARLYRMAGDPEADLRLKVYQLGGWLPLSDAVPALENFGFRVLAEIPTELDHGQIGTVHDFKLGLLPGDDADELMKRADTIENAITAVLNNFAENDVFNRLVVGTALTAEESNWLRAFYRYLRQCGTSFTIYTVVDALRGAPDVTRGLITLFRTRHDPAFTGDREQAAKDAEETIRDGLSNVAAINDDRLLRLYWASISASLRTNAFAPAAQEALAFKFDSSQVPGLPKPVPWREIFVYSRRVEGIHLRAGAVARGGLRWSDRRDDFRTEILGLMKAQRVKNAVIVPTGAKGGFYPKRLPDPALDREGWAAEGQASYEIFIRTLLSITDNIVDDTVTHPDQVVIHDGEDPYFVVAADKGTARFSDVANGIAESEDFWLDDAFASGGSNGYDHKAMGITAKGGWISVQRHFLEMGVDVQQDPVRVIGCGDMSGDVFGNGMLLSKAIKLVAAFDHRHIFLDPDPDPASAWEERKRLFDLPRSSWADYNEDLLSEGGGIFPRSMKRIPLSDEIRSLLGISENELDPDTLISTILKAEVDLLWFGGIGTYIKAERENNVQVGDPTNDSLRVDARDMRVKVIGEGANLGVTQAGRIEFALRGGRINTDFIDNSAGVDCSDNEVNIKIALASAVRAGLLDKEQRNRLLASMTDEVSDLVLEDNRLQALALSIAEIGGSRAVPAQTRLIETLEDIGELDRRTEGLADDESLARRAGDGHGLTRPELAVLLSNTKLVMQASIEECELGRDDALIPLLLADFPEAMRETYRQQILDHPLRKEIVATVIANRIINRMGPVHPFELAEEEGASLDQVAAAFCAATRLLRLEESWSALERADMPETARLMLFDRAAQALRGHVADLLRATGGDIAVGPLIESLQDNVDRLRGEVDGLLADEGRIHAQRMIDEMLDAGAPESFALDIVRLYKMDGAIGISRLAMDTGVSAVCLADAFVDLGQRMGIDWAQSRAAVMDPSDPWERLLVAGLARDFQQMRFDFLCHFAKRHDLESHAGEALSQWADNHAAALRRFRNVIARAQSAATVAPSMLAQIATQARNLLQR